MVYNFNGELREGPLQVSVNNRGLNYGDGVFETMKYANGRINFWEEHYFRLMSSMRILRMEIPMSFSPEFLEKELRKTIAANDLQASPVRVKLLVTRQSGGYYTPESNDIDFMIVVSALDHTTYTLNEEGLEVDLYRDFYKQKSLLSNLKTTSAVLYTAASVFRRENRLDECFLINDSRHLAEAISANVFLVKDKTVLTPSLKSGCLKGIIRKKVTELLPKMGYTVEEKEDISPFELQKMDEVFLTNSIYGIRWVKKYRKKEFSLQLSTGLIQKLNILAALD